MARKTGWDRFGVWSFIAGLIIVFLIALFAPNTGYTTTMALILGILGLIVGLLNIGDQEITLYLISTIAILISASSLSTISELFLLGGFVSSFLQGVIIFVAPGAAIVSLRALYEVAKD